MQISRHQRCLNLTEQTNENVLQAQHLHTTESEMRKEKNFHYHYDI